MAGRARVVEALLAEGANVNLTDFDGDSALHKAAREGFVDCARLLVEAGAELNTQEISGYTPLDFAVSRKRKVCGQYLRSKGAECNKKQYPADWEK